jgi:hypothetical protein
MDVPNTNTAPGGIDRPHRTQRKHFKTLCAKTKDQGGCPKASQVHTYFESLEHACIISAIDHVLAPHAARMRSCQVWIVASAACASNKGMDRPEWASTPARNSGRYRFLAVLEDHLSPAARPGPIHGRWAGPCAVKRTPSGVGLVWREQGAMRQIQIAQPLRTRSSHDLHTWVRTNQLATSITVICAGYARMRWSKSALTYTFAICSNRLNGTTCT